MDESIASLGHSRLIITPLHLMDLTMTSVPMSVQVSSASATGYMLRLLTLTLISVFRLKRGAKAPSKPVLISLWLHILTPLLVLVLVLVSCVTI